MKRTIQRCSVCSLGVLGLLLVTSSAWAYGRSAYGQSARKPGQDLIHPLVAQDMRGDGKIEVTMPMLPATGYFGMAPRASLYGGTGTVSYGIVVPMAVIFPDGGAAEFALGNLTADIKGRMCRRVGMRADVCFGGGLAVGTGFLDIDSTWKLAAVAMGAAASQDPVYYFAKNVVIRPVLVISTMMGGFFLQGEFGTAVSVPIIDTAAQNTEASLLWNFAAGYHIMGLFAPLVEFRGMNGVSNGLSGTDAYYLNLGARLTLAGIMPMIRIGIPLNTAAKLNDTNDIQIELGIAAHF